MKILKSILVIILLLIPIMIFKIPEYVELNDLAIIRGAGVSCHEDEVSLYFQEIIPMKGDAGITYQYGYYQGDGTNLHTAFQKIEDKNKKKLYLSKIKFLVTDCKTSTSFLKEFKQKDIKIFHVKRGVLKELKQIKM